MADPNNALWGYSLAWGAYLAAAFVILLILWRWTRRWQRDTRFLTLALLAVILLAPAPVPGHHPLLAPAMIFVVLGGVIGGVEVVAPVLVRFSLLGLAVLLLTVAEGVWWRARQRRRLARAKVEAARRAA